ncbi:protein affected trafficking 2 [Tasmannia lanceolata]|uniref:protein affected trafficking 2 n=1 Tax=Tasmannia lanceolata TaxID=3420 RepID=UPI004063EE13
MFPQFGHTAESLSKASSLMFRIGTDAHLYDDPEDVNIAPLLDSRFDSEISEALKRLLALIAQGFDVSNFFPQVVKNVASQSLEVKKLVYLYLLHYAEKRPNEALLSINCFQKDLSDPNPLVRAWALRAMAGIRLLVIAPLVLVAVTKCSRDPSAYVRKCAANALPKLYDLHQEENVSAIEELVGVLLNDNSPGVVGAAAAAFNSVCPNNLSLIGRNFKRLCETLPDVEEWGQIVLIEILLRYVVARHGLVSESIMCSLCSLSSPSEKDSVDVVSDNICGFTGGEAHDFKLTTQLFRCYIEGPDEYLSRSSYSNREPAELDSAIFTSGQNSDVKVLLQCTLPLLWSQNSAVVLAAAGVHWIMAPREDVKRIVKPILFIMRSSRASKYVVLCNLQVFTKAMPSLFAPYYEDFFICSSDSYQMKALKLEILSGIATDSSISFIFHEFQDYIKDPDRRFVADTIAAIGLCAQRLPSVANSCLERLLALTRQVSFISGVGSTDGEAGVLAQAIMSIKSIIKQNPATYEKVIIQLARSLDSIKVSEARAMIVWIVGEYNSVGKNIPRMIPTVLKYLAWCFSSEELEMKHQILNTMSKVVLCAQGEDLWTFQRLLSYVLELAKYDLDYDIRDRARFVSKLVSFHTASQCQGEGTPYLPENADLRHELAGRVFNGTTKSTFDTPNNFRFYLPGSLSQIVLHAAPGYEPLPKPCSLLYDELSLASKMPDRAAATSDSFEMNPPGTHSGSSDEESAYSYNSQHSVTSSVDSEGSDSDSDISDNDHNIEYDDNVGPLIRLSDAGFDYNKPNGSSRESDSTSPSTDLPELMSKKSLESWLDEQPGLPESSSSKQRAEQPSSARISIRDIGVSVRPKISALLDPANGNGLRVTCSFLSEISTISLLLVSVEISFDNCSTELLTEVALKDDDSDGTPDSANQALETYESSQTPHHVRTMIPMEEIASLEPGQMAKKTVQVRFHHHLLPLKLAVFCNGNKYPVKLRPDIGYFVKPLSMDIDGFITKESQLPGMFEYTRRCTFKNHMEEVNQAKDRSSVSDDKLLVVCQSLASKILSNANVFLVSVDMPVDVKFDDASGLCLRFSSEILSSSIPCLITILVEGKCTEPLDVLVKVNCEETVFGLNLLNRIVAFLT